MLRKLIAEKMMPFAEGEFVKEWLMAVEDIVCPEKKSLFSNVILSPKTITRRIEDLAADVRGSLKDICVGFDYFFVALDESIDLKDIAQLAVCIRAVMPNLDIVEEFVQLMAINDTTTGKDIFIALQRVLTDMKLDLTKLVSVTTDGAPAMVGQEKGVISLLERRMKDLGISHKIKKLHCIIQQEALCAKSLKLKEVMDVVIKTVNLILSRGLNHPQF